MLLQFLRQPERSCFAFWQTEMEGSVVEMNGVGSPTAGGSDEYFTSYDDLEIHRLMLEDTPRTTAYQRAIENVDLKGKVVMGKFNAYITK